MSWTIYKKNGEERLVTWQNNEATGSGIAVGGSATTPASRFVHPELEYHGEWMGECFVTLNVRCAVPIDFEIGDYIIYRGEKFVINYNPTVVKKARRGTYGEGFTYENVKFNSLSYELTDIRMLDYVLGDNDVHYSSLPKFDVFCNDVDDLADRLQVNADRYCNDNGITGRDRWLFVTPSQSRSLQRCGTDTDLRDKANDVYAEYFEDPAATSEEKVNQNVSVSNQTVWDTMKNIKDVFGLNFVVRGRVVVIGAAGLPTQDVFSYGKGNGLYEIERTADSEQQIITKLYAYGSDKNLPTRYYANLGMQCWTPCYRFNADGVILITIPVAPSSAYFKNEVEIASLGGARAYAVTIRVSSQGDTEHNVYVTDTSGIDNFPMENYSYVFGNDMPTLNEGDSIIFVKGIDKDKWPGNKSYPSTSPIPDNMALNVLMLPGFGDPNSSLYQWVKTHGGTDCVDATGKATWRGHTAYFSKEANNPYILSENYLELGIREATKNFDGSDGDEIYPTITGTGHDTIVDAEVIEDDGAFADGAEIPTFTITLPDFGSDFDLKELLQNDSAIEVTSGYCGGRSFTISSAKMENGVWVCTCQRDPDEDLDIYFPYAHKGVSGENLPYQLRTGDKYVLTGIEMTETYVNAAAVNLLEAALVFLEQNDYTRYTFSPKVDELFMARQHDGFMSGNVAFGNRSYYESIKEGDIMLFEDDDLHVDGSVYIDNLTIKEYGNGQIPTYEVTLRNDKQVGTIQRLQDQINSLSSGGGVVGVGGGGSSSVNIPQIRQLIQAYGKELFISKIAADVANGLITFLKGIQIGAEGAWGWVKEITVEGEQVVKAWFKNLYADYLEPTIMKVADKILGPLTVAGNLFVQKDSNNQGGDITVAGDINAPDGSVNAQDGNFTSSVTTKNLTVTGLAHFFELMIDKLRSSGGAFVFTPADGFSVEDVENTTFGGIACKRLWWRASDGETETGNQWLVGDQAICMSFNLAKKNIGGVMTDVSNKMFWSVVCDKDTEEHLYPNGDTAMSHYITIYSGTGTEQTIPTDSDDKPLWDGEPSAVEIGDDIAMLGHRMQDATEQASEDMKARQSAVYITAYASYDTELTPPLMAFYKGVDDFDLSSHRGTYMDANGSRFVGRFVSSSTNQDIENLMNGSEIDIIYGNGNPNTVSRPHSVWNDDEQLRRVDKTLYFDLDLEPASEGGRLWKWTHNTTTGTGYIWVQINDVDSTAALDMISDVASDGVLTGGAEKTRVYLEWVDAKKTRDSLLAQADEKGLDQYADATNPDDCYKTGVTYQDAMSNLDDAFHRLSTYLNGKVNWVESEQTVPSWISGANLSVTQVLPPWTEMSEDYTTGPITYKALWDAYYDAAVEMSRALNAAQYKAIDDMGDDGLIDATEKAILRQTFADEVKAYISLYEEGVSIKNKISAASPTISDKIVSAYNAYNEVFNRLGTYLDNAEVIGYMVNVGGIPPEEHFTWWISNDKRWVERGTYDSEDYSVTSTYHITWNNFKQSSLLPENVYPLWLTTASLTKETPVSNSEWDTFWKAISDARIALQDAINEGKQFQLENVDVELAKTLWTRFSDSGAASPSSNTTPQIMPGGSGMSFKAGDQWNEEVSLLNPTTNERHTTDSEGKKLYNVYICIDDYSYSELSYNNRFNKWQKVSKPTLSSLDNDGSSIKAAVFADEEFSSLVMDVNGVTSTVGAIRNASPNLLLNGNFEDDTSHFAAYNNSAISVVTGQGLSSFEHYLQVTSNSSGSRGIKFTTDEQPYITLTKGKTYTLSLWAMATATKYLYVQRDKPNSFSVAKSIDTNWTRYTWKFTGDGEAYAFNIYDASNNSATYYITGLQLEEGDSATEWQDFGGGLVNLQSQINQSASQISLAVKKDGVESCGLLIDGENETTTLYGNKITINGDLDIKGSITNSSQTADYNDNYDDSDISQGEWSGFVHDDGGVSQMVVPVDFTKVKSVVVRGLSDTFNGAIEATNTHPLVVLPAYNLTRIEGMTNNYPLQNFRVSGRVLTISNHLHTHYWNWSKVLSLGGSSNSANLPVIKERWNAATIIISDPNLLKFNNYGEGVGTRCNSGLTTNLASIQSVFCCNGNFSKILAVMPGQSVTLVSSVEERPNGQYFIVWNVQNAADFVPVNGGVRFSTYVGTKRTDYDANFFGTGDHYDTLRLLAPTSLSPAEATCPVVKIRLKEGLWPWRDPVQVNGNATNWNWTYNNTDYSEDPDED